MQTAAQSTIDQMNRQAQHLVEQGKRPQDALRQIAAEFRVVAGDENNHDMSSDYDCVLYQMGHGRRVNCWLWGPGSRITSGELGFDDQVETCWPDHSERILYTRVQFRNALRHYLWTASTYDGMYPLHVYVTPAGTLDWDNFQAFESAEYIDRLATCHDQDEVRAWWRYLCVQPDTADELYERYCAAISG